MSSEATQSELSMSGDALQPVLSDRYALTWRHAAICTVFSGLFMFLNYIPLFHTEIWRHVAWGDWIIANQSIPSSNPLLELAGGMEYFNSAWLSQVIMATIQKFAGVEGLSALLAIVQTTTLILIAYLFYRLSQSNFLMLAGLATVLAVWFGQMGILRPQVFGGLCLSVLLVLLSLIPSSVNQPKTEQAKEVTSQPQWSLIIGIGLLMALWTNLDSSFLVGILVILGYSLGGLFSIWKDSRQFKATIQSPGAWHYIYLAEICLLATWLNPQGVVYWFQVVSLESNPLLVDNGGIRPLTLYSWQGLWFVMFWMAAIWSFKHSRLPIGMGPTIVLALLTGLATLNGLMLTWFAPIALAILLPHCSAALNRGDRASSQVNSTPEKATAKPQKVSFTFSLVSLLVVWTVFAFSPISTPILGGQPRPSEVIHNRHTPLVLAEQLRNAEPKDLVWMPQYWGDFMHWTSRGSVRVFLNSETQAIPKQVQDDYVRVFRGNEGWERVLERYAVGTIAIDKQRQKNLFRKMLTNGKQWKITFEDPDIMILVRVKHSIEGCNCGNEG